MTHVLDRGTRDRTSEFDRQVETLIGKGFPALAGIEPAAFAGLLKPLKGRLSELAEPSSDTSIDFVIVAGDGLVPRDLAIPLVELSGRSAFTSMASEDLARFTPSADLGVPGASPYLLVDIDVGATTLNVPPAAALPTITAAGRSPLTVDEGLSLVLHRPEVLTSQNCFSMLGSRCGDKRVTAVWLSKKQPRFGWCWEGAPHTWLGSASCGRRVLP